MKTIAILGTFDTKGKEFKYIKDLIEAAGLQTLCIHTGVFEPLFTPDVSNAEVAAAVGVDLAALAARKDRGEAMDVMARGAEKLVPELFARGRLDGILSIGGSGGTSLATPAMRALPVGVPKVMVSTMASGNVAQYVGTSDIIMIPSVVDAEGLNEISKRIFTNAANAIVGMVANYREIPNDGKPLLAADRFARRCQGRRRHGIVVVGDSVGFSVQSVRIVLLLCVIFELDSGIGVRSAVVSGKSLSAVSALHVPVVAACPEYPECILTARECVDCENCRFFRVRCQGEAVA